MNPDEALFRHHIAGAGFQAEVDLDKWGIAGDNTFQTWPAVLIWVRAAEKPNCPDRYYFRFDLSGYPSSAPTACPWDFEKNSRLDNARWPRGSKYVSATFNYGWNQNALYAPCDRAAMPGHDSWRTQFPELWWTPDFDITVYLHFLFRLLNSPDYAKS